MVLYGDSASRVYGVCPYYGCRYGNRLCSVHPYGGRSYDLHTYGDSVYGDRAYGDCIYGARNYLSCVYSVDLFYCNFHDDYINGFKHTYITCNEPSI